MQKLKNNEARPKFTDSYKKKRVRVRTGFRMESDSSLIIKPSVYSLLS